MTTLYRLDRIDQDYANWSKENDSSNPDPSVAKVPMDRINYYLGTDHLEVVMEGPAWAGGLITYKPAVPIFPKQLPFSGVDLEMFVDDDTLAQAHVFECGDLKRCIAPYMGGTQLPNVADYSVQNNLGEGGMWQIDNAVPAWADAGIKTPIAANQWGVYKFRHWTDLANLKASFLSIQAGETVYPIPAAMQGMPLLATGWNFNIGPQKTPGMAYQFQMGLGPNPGVLIARIRVSLTLSEGAIE